MTKIYIGFSYPKKFKLFAWLIAKWIKKDYSHVYIRFISSEQKIPSNIYHAANGMVHFLEFNNFKNKNTIIKEYELSISKEDRLKTLIHCMYLSGEAYGYLEIVKILITDILNFFNVKLDTKNSKGYICSELVAALIESKFNLQINKPRHLLKPNDIEDLIKELG